MPHKSKPSLRPWAAIALALSLLAAALVGPGTGAHAGTVSAWSNSIWNRAIVAPRPSGGVTATFLTNGPNTPSGSEELVGFGAGGQTDWTSPYPGQGTSSAPASDADGDYYYARYLQGSVEIVAARDGAKRWSLDVGPNSAHQLAVGVNRQLYDFAANALHGYDASTGRELFAPVDLSGFTNGSFGRLYAYSGGLIAFSGAGKIAYIGYDGHLISGPNIHDVPQASIFFRSTGASADGSLYAVWYTQGLASEGCLDANGDAVLAKFTPAGRAWIRPLPHVSRCNFGGPFVAATPDGGAVVTSAVIDASLAPLGGVDVQYVDGSGNPGWHKVAVPPAGGVLKVAVEPHVDVSGRVLVAFSFYFNCNMPNSCLGTQVSQFGSDGTSLEGVLLQGSTTTNQEGWNLVGANTLVAAPGQVILLTYHQAGDRYASGTHNIGGYPLPGLGAEYPQAELWRQEATPGPVDRLALRDTSIVASRNDLLLKRTINFAPEDPEAQIARYEYGWGTATAESPVSLQSCSVSLPKCWLDYRQTNPNQVWRLFIRAVGTNGSVGPWLTRQIKTPKKFILIVFGDSVSSGHHRDGESKPTICQDENYSYGKAIWDKLQSQVPSQWRSAHGYINVANSGFGTAQIITGGKDACGSSHPAELPTIKKWLASSAGSWTWVVGDGGINDTNWGKILADILASGRVKTSAQCQVYVDRWDYLTKSRVRATISANVKEIAKEVLVADPTARTIWNSYYNPAGSGGKLKLPQVCRGPFDSALKKLHANLQGASQGFGWSNLGAVLNGRPDLLQTLYYSDIAFMNPGWPHPNSNGHVAIAKRILAG